MSNIGKRNLFLTQRITGRAVPRVYDVISTDICVYGVTQDEINPFRAPILTNPEMLDNEKAGQLLDKIRAKVRSCNEHAAKENCIFVVHWGGLNLQDSGAKTNILRANMNSDDNFLLTYWSSLAPGDPEYVGKIFTGAIAERVTAAEEFWCILRNRDAAIIKSDAVASLKHSVAHHFLPIDIDLQTIEIISREKPGELLNGFNGIVVTPQKFAERLQAALTATEKVREALILPREAFDVVNFVTEIKTLQDTNDAAQSFVGLYVKAGKNLFHGWFVEVMKAIT